MRNERDELAAIIARRRYAKDARPAVWVTGRAALEVADVLLAAGYRKPRTITTAEELDALPVESVVLADGYRHHANGMPIAFQRWNDGTWHRGARSGDTHPDNIVPAAVLWEPQP